MGHLMITAPQENCSNFLKKLLQTLTERLVYFEAGLENGMEFLNSNLFSANDNLIFFLKFLFQASYFKSWINSI